MLKTSSQGQRADRKQTKFDAKIAAVATAVPEHRICQAEITKRAREVFPHLARLESLYGNTGIETLYACQPPDRYYQRHGWETRTAIFQRHALDLLEEVALKATKARLYRARRYWCPRCQHHHRACHSKSRCEADEPAPTASFSGASADFRAWLWGRRWGARPRRSLCASHAGWLACPVSHHRPLLALPANCRSEYRNVCGSRAVWRWGGGSGSSQHSRNRYERGAGYGARRWRSLLAKHRADHGMGHQGGWIWGSAEPRVASAHPNRVHACAKRFSRCKRHGSWRVQRVYHAPWGGQDPTDHPGIIATFARGPCLFLGRAPRFRQHVVAHSSIRARQRGERWRSRAALAYGIRPRLLSLLCCH